LEIVGDLDLCLFEIAGDLYLLREVDGDLGLLLEIAGDPDLIW